DGRRLGGPEQLLAVVRLGDAELLAHPPYWHGHAILDEDLYHLGGSPEVLRLVDGERDRRVALLRAEIEIDISADEVAVDCRAELPSVRLGDVEAHVVVHLRLSE